METARFDFSGSNAVRRGSVRRLKITFKQSNGALLNFAGCTAIAGFRVGAAQYNFTVSFEEPRHRGSILLVIPANLTANLPTGRYAWDLLITMSNGDAWRAVEGNLYLQGGVTRSN